VVYWVVRVKSNAVFCFELTSQRREKEMSRLWRSRKANVLLIWIFLMFFLSAWMGSLTFTFKQTEELSIVGVDFNADDTIDIHVQNTGTVTVTITDVKVDYAIIDVTDISVHPGESYEVIGVPCAWVEETKYDIVVMTNTGNTFMYRVMSPSS
jgi:zona occludens toxin (predicted ATPase)